MKILAIVPSAFCYGLQNLTLSFFGNLSPRVQPFFLNTVWNDGEFPRRLDALGIPHQETYFGMVSRKLTLQLIKWVLHGLVMLPVGWFDFLCVVRRFRPDVIYVAERHAMIQLLPFLLWMRPKVVFHMHDPPPNIPFQRASFAVWRRAVGRFFFISENVRARTALLGPLGPRDVVIHNGVSVAPLPLPRIRDPRFVRQFGWPEDCVIVGITGQMNPNKGHEDFLAAARTCAAEHLGLRFVIGGKPIAPFDARLAALVLEYGLADRVGFSGWLPSSQDFYSAVDILVLASRHDEGFGLVVAEAMERGAAVIATRSGGAVEIVEDGVSGFLVAKGAPAEIADRLSALTADPKLREHLATAGRARVECHFDLARQVREFEERLCDVV